MGSMAKTAFFQSRLVPSLAASLAFALLLTQGPAFSQNTAIDMSESMSAMPGLFPGSRPMAPAASPELIEARSLIFSKRWTEAAKTIEAQLEKRPRDPQWRFLQGVLFAEIGKRNESITVFELLTEDFPELAEPYNNLAALYIEGGELHRARLLLERAIQNRPDYALAHENLGDVYARLAKQSYDRASKSRQPSPAASIKFDYLDKMPALRSTRVLTNR
jgi:tetratricopeptide (TPR) repeat protein